ncbi:cyclin-D4-2 [Cajanus cajan]|uniref:B-like cyclin n=1 Tax=Cajanus cajan TaxID=3821 RepID=A0A151RXJ3_CAJCA|nr:cyclin-D4-2 [Cajanus cajan]KYP47270.1 Cyclin-D4-1 [Cajanus cajan]
MAPSFDCVSSLLCAEDNSIFDENDYGGSGEMLDDTWQHPGYDRSLSLSENLGGPIGGFPLMSDDCLRLMVEKEFHHLPNGDYVNRLRSGDLNFEARNEAIDWIEKVREHFSFGPLCAYLSINYLDRFLSEYELPKKGWTMQLLAVGCLSLAAKMEETDVPLSLDLQVGESKYIFEAKTVQRMELLVLSTLRWRMQAVTPFSFIDYFLHKINDGQSPNGDSILQSIQLILSTVRGIDFLEFRPSEIAAAVAIHVVGEAKTVHSEEAISVLLQLVEKERVLKCVKMFQELSSNSDSAKDASASVSVPCVPKSPIGVLDTACFSFKSDDTNAASCANSPHNNSPDAKRRRLNKTFGE